MALVRVYCGLASADPADRSATAGRTTLTSAVVDDAGRLLQVREINDDPAGYAQLVAFLVDRVSGPNGAVIAADSDDHLVTSLLSAAGRPLAIADDDSVDDFAERFADDDSATEIEATPTQRRAVGLARALQAGVLSAVTFPPPRDLVAFKPLLAAHAAMANGRHAAAVALREVLRELYPAALRAYADPAEAVPLAVLDALPEPGLLTGAGPDRVPVEAIAAQVGNTKVEEVATAVTALRVAIRETPRRGALNTTPTSAVADAVRQAVAAVRACDTGCRALIATLDGRAATPPATGSFHSLAQPGSAARPSVPVAEPAPAAPAARPEPVPLPSRRTRQPTNGVSVPPQPTAPPPVAPTPVMPPPLAPPPVTPAAALSTPTPPAQSDTGRNFPSVPGRRAERSGGRPVSATPPQGMTRITPGERPSVPPVDAGEPFRATLTTAAINSARAERQRPTPVVPRGTKNNGETGAPARGFGATDLSVPVPAPRPAADSAPPGSRAKWPLVNPGEEQQGSEPRYAPEDAAGPDAEADRGDGERRVTPPWLADDLPQEPPVLRLVESTPLPTRARPGEQDRSGPQGGGGGGNPLENPPLRLVDPGRPAQRDVPTPRRRDIEPKSAPPVAAEGDGDLLIFASIRSAWFSDPSDEDQAEWASTADTGWLAAEQAARPAVGAETQAGLPIRVPQANLVPGSALHEERPLRIVRDAARMAEHTTGYFRGWRKGQEIGGYAVGGRPGRESAGGWDFSRDHDDREMDGEYEYRSAGYRS